MRGVQERGTVLPTVSEPGAAGGALRSTDRPRRPLLGRMAAVVAVVVAADQITKSWAVDRLADGNVDVFWTLRFNLGLNSGMAFSQGEGLTRYITVVGVLLVAGLTWWSRNVTSPRLAVAIALLIGGAMGNLADRFFRPGGAVVDFIDLQWWPVFNVADIAIALGAMLLLVTTWREPATPAAAP